MTEALTDMCDYETKNIRGAAASKCRNLGMSYDTILERGRWASRDTFLQYYYRACEYTNREPAQANWSIERLLRFRAQRA